MRKLRRIRTAAGRATEATHRHRPSRRTDDALKSAEALTGARPAGAGGTVVDPLRFRRVGGDEIVVEYRVVKFDYRRVRRGRERRIDDADFARDIIGVEQLAVARAGRDVDC